MRCSFSLGLIIIPCLHSNTPQGAVITPACPPLVPGCCEGHRGWAVSGHGECCVSLASGCLLDFFFVGVTVYNSLDFPGGISGKEPACRCRKPKKQGFSPWVRKTPLEEGMATHSSILAWENLMDRGAWGATVHRVTESDVTEVTWHTCTHTWESGRQWLEAII